MNKHDCPTHGDTTDHPDLITCDTCGREWHYTERDWPPPPQQAQPARSQEGWHNCIPECDCLASTTCTERR